MQGKPAQADVAPPQPPSGVLRCPGPLGLQLARELTRRSRRPLIKQNETPKMGLLRKTTGMLRPSICGSCRFVGDQSRDRTAFALMRSSGIAIFYLVREICDLSKSRSNAQAF